MINRYARTATAAFTICAAIAFALPAEARGGRGGFGGGGFNNPPPGNGLNVATGNGARYGGYGGVGFRPWGVDGYYGLNRNPTFRGYTGRQRYGYGFNGASYGGYGGVGFRPWGVDGYYGLNRSPTYRGGYVGAGYGGRGYGYGGGIDGGYGFGGGLYGAPVSYGGVPTYGAVGSTNCTLTQSTYYDDAGYTSTNRVRTCY